MSIQAKLIIDDLEINVLKFSYSFSREYDVNFNPTNKPTFNGITLVIEARKELNLAEWAVSPNQTKKTRVTCLV